MKGSPQERRTFLDTALCQISPKYLENLREYTRLVDQKNSLLKDARNISAAFDMMDIYDEKIAETASFIASEREKFIEKMREYAGEAYSSISENREKLNLEYSSTVYSEGYEKENILEIIRNSRNDDIRSGFCTVGIHRDDMNVFLDGENAKTFGSQGQQRTAVLAMKLAEAEVFSKYDGEEPVLLLDDVLSELDGSRQEFLLKRLGKVQAVITCCEPSFIEKRTDAEIYKMKSGVLSKL